MADPTTLIVSGNPVGGPVVVVSTAPLAMGARGADGAPGADGEPGQQGAVGPTGPAYPKSITASSVGIAVANSATTNFDAYEAWRTNPAFDVFELFFGETGTYNFDGLLVVPAGRGLRGTSMQFTILRYTGASAVGAGSAFIRGESSEFFLDDFTASVRDGSTVAGLLDYVIASIGSLSPSQAGPTVWANNVYAQFGMQACWYGLNSAFQLYHCNAFGGEGQNCYFFEGCSESLLDACFASVWVHAAVKNVGLYATGTSVLNGGKLTITAFVAGSTPPGDYGLDIQGTANCDVTGCTIEGADVAAFFIRDGSQNIHLRGTRSNGGTHVIFDRAVYCRVEGACSSAAIANGVYHRGNSRDCKAAVVVETNVGVFDVDQLYGDGTTKWIGQRRDLGGPAISKANTAPTDGYWEIGERVIPRTASVGNPREWACTTNGQPLNMTVTVTFTAVGGTADTIFRASGSWIDAGVIAGAALITTGTVSNNNTYTVASVTADTITLTPGSPNLVTEGPVSATIRGTGVFLSLGNV